MGSNVNPNNGGKHVFGFFFDWLLTDAELTAPVPAVQIEKRIT
jgi:hypothetical protein